MEKIKAIVYEELKDKNAGPDTIKLVLRVAFKASGLLLTEREKTQVYRELMLELPFNPLEKVF